MRDVFLVKRFGAYDRGVVGIFSSKIKAETAMKKAKYLEPDDHHEFKIVPIEINKQYDVLKA